MSDRDRGLWGCKMSERSRFGAVALLCVGLSGCSDDSTSQDDPATTTGNDDDAAVVTSASPSSSASQPVSPPPSGSAPALFTAAPMVQVTATSQEQPPDLSQQPLLTCLPAIADGTNPLIDNMEDGDLEIDVAEGRVGAWYPYEETAGDHELENVELDSARLGSTHAVYSSAVLHGNWAGLSINWNECVVDATHYKGLHFWAKGDEALLRVALITPGVVPVSEGGTCTREEEGLCWDGFGSELFPSSDWQEYFVPFAELEQGGWGADADMDLSRIYAIQFQSEAGPFEFWLDDLEFYTEEVYTPYDAGGVPELDAGSSVPQDASVVPSVNVPEVDAAQGVPSSGSADAAPLDGGNP